MSSLRRPRLSSIALSLLAVVAAVTGCNKEPAAPTFAKISPADENALRDRIDAVVDHTLNNRTLNTHDHNAWQVVHGILPYGRAFRIDHDGQMIYALDWLLQGGALSGWDLRPGPNGVIAVLAPGSKAAQGHPDQWIGYLSQGGLDGIHGLSKDEPITVQGKQYKMDDLLTEAEWDVTPGMEASWTVMAMTAWRPLDYSWTSSDGEKWTFERLVGMDAGEPVVGEGASCGGTHRLFGLTVAVNRYMKETGTPPDKLTGGWKKAYDVIKDCERKARAYQQPENGNFSAAFFLRPGSSPDVDTTLHATGHTLEWLSVALSDDEIQQPWVTAAVARLCQLLEDNRDRQLDCGALYHAARGLRLYRDRRFGPVDLSSATVASVTPTKKSAAAASDDSAPAPPSGINQ